MIECPHEVIQGCPASTKTFLSHFFIRNLGTLWILWRSIPAYLVLRQI